jgi:hypothetical protein
MTYPKNRDGSTTVARVIDGKLVPEPEVPGTVPQWIVELYARQSDRGSKLLVCAVETTRGDTTDSLRDTVWVNGEPVYHEREAGESQVDVLRELLRLQLETSTKLVQPLDADSDLTAASRPLSDPAPTELPHVAFDTPIGTTVLVGDGYGRVIMTTLVERRWDSMVRVAGLGRYGLTGVKLRCPLASDNRVGPELDWLSPEWVYLVPGGP